MSRPDSATMPSRSVTCACMYGSSSAGMSDFYGFGKEQAAAAREHVHGGHRARTTVTPPDTAARADGVAGRRLAVLVALLAGCHVGVTIAANNWRAVVVREYEATSVWHTRPISSRTTPLTTTQRKFGEVLPCPSPLSDKPVEDGGRSWK